MSDPLSSSDISAMFNTDTLMSLTSNGRLIHALSTVSAGPVKTWEAINRVIGMAMEARQNGNRVFFIGNGGSAGIASHMAADWMKAGGFAAMCFNDGASLTCLSNDLGYASVFSHPIAKHARSCDLLFAISSSGKSENILEAVKVARSIWANVVTLSGFAPNNPLRSMGHINFYVECDRYGIVEVSHHAILHAILDRITKADEGQAS